MLHHTFPVTRVARVTDGEEFRYFSLRFTAIILYILVQIQFPFWNLFPRKL